MMIFLDCPPIGHSIKQRKLVKQVVKANLDRVPDEVVRCKRATSFLK